MSENEQNSKVEQAKQKAGALYEKGNELMDKVSFLKNPRNKKIAWGVLGAVCLLAVIAIVGSLFGGGQAPFDVAKKALMACASGDSIAYLSLSGDDASFSSEEQRLAHSIVIKKNKELMDEAASKPEEEAKLFFQHMKKEFREDFGMFVVNLIKKQMDSNTDSWAFENWSDDVWAMVEQAFGRMKEVETKVNDNKATVVASVSLKGKDIKIKIHLQKVEGEWKVNTEATERETWLH